VIPGAAHHVTQRGNNRQDIFLSDGDRQLYLTLLARAFSRHLLPRSQLATARVHYRARQKRPYQ
jgi:hypothetical protein